MRGRFRGSDIDLDGHSQIVRGETGPSTVQRYRLPWIAHRRDAIDVAISTTFGPNTLVSFKVWTDEVKST